MQEPLSKRLLEWFGVPIEDEKILRKKLNERLKHIIKPCWELKFCPYGPIVEDYPLPPLLVDSAREHNEYLKECVKLGKMGENHDIPIDEERMRMFIKWIDEYSEVDYVIKRSNFEAEASCREFGHLCPVYFVSESLTETADGRNRRRSFPNSTIIRVVRRDNNTCQICGKILLDKEIEIDHIIPYSRGGSSEESNLRVTCLKCNRKKGRKINL